VPGLLAALEQSSDIELASWSPCGNFLALSTSLEIVIYQVAPDATLVWEIRERIKTGCCSVQSLGWFMPQSSNAATYTLSEAGELKLLLISDQSGPEIVFGEFAIYFIVKDKVNSCCILSRSNSGSTIPKPTL
jgi:hypothetical protein